jgi:hypothetical protein
MLHFENYVNIKTFQRHFLTIYTKNGTLFDEFFLYRKVGLKLKVLV